jgi:NADPH-dependent 2,4-dienoyl-CoA reductase/sulfur reductase-like enzyme
LKIGRRKFLGTGSAALVGLSLKTDRPIAGSFVNDSFQMGHLLRGRASFPSATRVEKYPIVIVGGGIAGLSAAWRLRKRGFTDFVLLEMNTQAGGNARWGENEITPYPWAAHYVPVPGPKTANGKNATFVLRRRSAYSYTADGKKESNRRWA